MAFLTDMAEHNKSLALAGEILRSLLPQKSPKIRGLDIAGKNITCDKIGGDCFDFLWDLECQDNHFDAVVGDVAGHGVDAALLMTSARVFLRMNGHVTKPIDPDQLFSILQKWIKSGSCLSKVPAIRTSSVAGKGSALALPELWR